MPPDPQDPNSPNSGAEAPEPRQSLREVAESAYDEGIHFRQPQNSLPPRVVECGTSRDDLRLKPRRRPGEAEGKSLPAPRNRPEAQNPPDPAAQARSNQPPDHWSAEDRADFDEAAAGGSSDPPHAGTREMEADYTRKSQANAGAVQAVQRPRADLSGPRHRRSRSEQAGIHPMQAIHDWARLHKGAVSADPQGSRLPVLIEIAERMGFDPASCSPQVASRRRPAARDGAGPGKSDTSPISKAGPTANLQALRAELQAFKQQETETARSRRRSRSTGWSIDTFADEKGADGNRCGPTSTSVLPCIVECSTGQSRARPGRSLSTRRCWMIPRSGRS